VNDITSRVGLGLFGSGYLALGANQMREFFDSSILWKQGYNPSLLSLSLAF